MRHFFRKNAVPASLMLVLVLALSLGLLACGSNSTGSTATTTSGSGTTAGSTGTTTASASSTTASGTATTDAGSSTGSTIKVVDNGGKSAAEWQAELPKLEKAVQDNSTDLTALQALAIAQYQLKKYDDAAATYEKMLAIKDEPLTHNNYGNVLRDSGKNDLAIAQYQKAIDGDPTLVVAYINLSVMYSNAGDKANADKVLSQGIAATTGDGQTRLKAVKAELDGATTTTT
jgi:Tfp pilus assembly protein PilF